MTDCSDCGRKNLPTSIIINEIDQIYFSPRDNRSLCYECIDKEIIK